MKIASLSLRDYTDDLVRFVNSLDHPPLLIGHSMGGLLAQLVAARTRQASPLCSASVSVSAGERVVGLGVLVRLNRFDQFVTEIEGLDIDFVHQWSRHQDAFRC
jgi:pimeloyl-ACP methyl ester carboxylesterase